ncbi:helix-turn-helix domain-containing protein [Massilia cavernae]|uniref:helix-turn-helix domain-containing protein n=1 Tax=Massilia cavernae TaxID=2320864 RepID=UPI001E58BAD3|nr:helix-turn-helix transcriptional regulator [Massilia cavernae]
MDQDFTYHDTDIDERVGAENDRGNFGGLHSAELKRFRVGKRESQEKFWGRFGVTQSSGSRFETGLGIPAPVAILVKLYLNGKLTDGDLPG